MNDTWLVQRSEFIDRPGRKGIDKILALDYMGSAEFEIDMQKKSLYRIREILDEYTYFDHTFKNGKIITIFYKKGDRKEILERIVQIANEKLYLKEHCDLINWLRDGDSYSFNDHWWDIDNDFMFWKKNNEFTEKFKEYIKG